MDFLYRKYLGLYFTMLSVSGLYYKWVGNENFHKSENFLNIIIIFFMSHISSVSIVTRLWAGQLDSIPRRGQDIFIFSVGSRPALWPTQPPIQGVPWALSLEGKSVVA
jgi:hypothetical protein